ncbi:hypothetical protein [Pseudomonas sp. NY15354]|uniref:hypothetical protein n=1 Tax=Pseudomonas sp. NY15354 TaxID=3400351 RepID=UPI003A85D7DD
MPTENRSSNTEMVSVQATIESLEEAYAGDSALDFMNDAAQLLRQFKAISTPQPHPDPVALPERKEVVEEWATPGGPYRAEGWNACLDEIANLGPLYTRPAPADPGEVERLRAEIEEWNRIFDMQEGKIDAIRAQQVERDALLRETKVMLSSELSYELFHKMAEHIKRIDAALSSSAEPTAREVRALQIEKELGIERLPAEPSATVIHPISMKTMMQAYEQVDHKALLHGTSNWCAAMVCALRGVLHAEPSAPAAQPGKCLDGGDCGIGGTCKWCPHTTASPAQQPS